MPTGKDAVDLGRAGFRQVGELPSFCCRAFYTRNDQKREPRQSLRVKTSRYITPLLLRIANALSCTSTRSTEDILDSSQQESKEVCVAPDVHMHT